MIDAILAQLTESVVSAQQQAALDLTRQALAAGLEPLTIIDKGLTPGMRIVGDKFACGDYFIPHLVLAGRTMKGAMALLDTRDRDGWWTRSISTAPRAVEESSQAAARRRIGAAIAGIGVRVALASTRRRPPPFRGRTKSTSRPC